MKLAYVDLCGFRGYRKHTRFDFSSSFTVIDGRNGVGKSTIFDAVEFALTGTISKYLDAKASGESVENYIWWSGTPKAEEQYVEAGFCEDGSVYSVRRTPNDDMFLDIKAVTSKLLDGDSSPKNALHQLCSATIIRDEHIARLSLDLKEGDRFRLLRDAIGAVDAEEWIDKAQRLSSTTSSRARGAQAEADQARTVLSGALLRIDQARSAIPAASLTGEAETRLQVALRSTARADQLADVARQQIAAISTRVELCRSLIASVGEVEPIRLQLAELDRRVTSANDALASCRAVLEQRTAALVSIPVSSALASQARNLESLVNLGREIGLRDNHCPLCESSVNQDQFEYGLQMALDVARQLDSQAVVQAQRERERDEAQRALQVAELDLAAAVGQRDAGRSRVAEFDKRAAEIGISEPSAEGFRRLASTLEQQQATLSADLRILDTIGLNQALVRANDEESGARERISRAEARLGRARLAETRAKAIHDAARRSSAETLDQRLDRVLPLMSELYKRLRPHPIWGDIEYKVRGDVSRFLKLQVGDGINPQFVFSSGQRRATGLAFLLSINLSIAWSRWQSILLDDPVQHVDDFRTVHLAEVLAQLCAGGRQIICAVEDSALADLMCRRLPSSEANSGRHVTLGTDTDGALAIVNQRRILPFSRRTLVVGDRADSA